MLTRFLGTDHSPSTPNTTKMWKAKLPRRLRRVSLLPQILPWAMFFSLAPKYGTKRELSTKCLVFQFLKFTFR